MTLFLIKLAAAWVGIAMIIAALWPRIIHDEDRPDPDSRVIEPEVMEQLRARKRQFDRIDPAKTKGRRV